MYSFLTADSFPISDGVQIVHQPFAFAALPNFLAPDNQDKSTTTASLIDALEAEARKLPLHRRQNDLFSLNQSDDLKSLCQKGNETAATEFPLLRQLREFFATDFLAWMKDVTGAELDENEVDSSISRYEPTDYLLCHDDELERRRIAFVIYLVPEDWDRLTDGGCLDLIDSGPMPDKCGRANLKSNPGDYHPWHSVMSLPPARNCLVFFEVCPRSFHQVAEIIGSRDRLSVHGWFKSDPLPRPPRSPDPLNIPRLPACFVEEDLVYRWINPLYLNVEQQQLIRRRFKSTSEIRLPDFLIKTVNSLAIVTLNRIWVRLVISNLLTLLTRRNISVLPYLTEKATEALPEECRQVHRLFRSEAILVILSDLTGIGLHPLAAAIKASAAPSPSGDALAVEEASDAKRRKTDDDDGLTTCPDDGPVAELTAPRFHRWKAGMYTLLADADSTVLAPITAKTTRNWRLDTFYHISGYGKCSPAAKQGRSTGSDSATTNQWQGQIIYISRSENEELLRIAPEDNALALVYCDSDAQKFTRYLNNRTKPVSTEVGVEQEFAYELSLTYFDPSPGEEDEDGDSQLQETESESYEDYDEDDLEEIEADETGDEEVNEEKTH
ncbi:unnamed protein product [Schistocephalus solidus]|uniref:Fe2OG dioxygenase domain-containing protein n=1 Tax=Schistocephalus solidus TaxID=70667 RepID=A0A183S781_SCHSO|nr:unnamed protein product [Schistocephalus solidus]